MLSTPHHLLSSGRNRLPLNTPIRQDPEVRMVPLSTSRVTPREGLEGVIAIDSQHDVLVRTPFLRVA